MEVAARPLTVTVSVSRMSEVRSRGLASTTLRVCVVVVVSPEGSLTKASAVGYYLRDFGNRFASVDNTAIVFLGTQIGCAQCHDHPYDEWSRRSYHEFAAWMTGIDSRRVEDSSMSGPSEGDMIGLKDRTPAEHKRNGNKIRRVVEVLRKKKFQIISTPKGYELQH